MFLTFEFLALFEGGVFFFVHVGHFLGFDEEFGSGRDLLAGGGALVGFGEGRHAFWVVDDEGWSIATGFKVDGREFVEEAWKGGN